MSEAGVDNRFGVPSLVPRFIRLCDATKDISGVFHMVGPKLYRLVHGDELVLAETDNTSYTRYIGDDR